MSSHRILRVLIALYVPFFAALLASAQSDEERPKIKHAERLLSRLDPDGELLRRASDLTRQKSRELKLCYLKPRKIFENAYFNGRANRISLKYYEILPVSPKVLPSSVYREK